MFVYVPLRGPKIVSMCLCISPPPIYSPPLHKPIKKRLTNLYKPKAYNQVYGNVVLYLLLI